MENTFIEKKEVVGKALASNFIIMLMQVLGRKADGNFTNGEAVIFASGVWAGMIMAGVSEDDVKFATDELMKVLQVKKKE